MATAAAAVVVVAAPPAFGWVTARIQEIIAPGAPQEAPAPPVQEVPTVTAFRPAGPEIELSFEASDTRGLLRVQPAPDSLLVLEVPSTRIGLMVHRERVGIQNVVKPDGSYRLLVPVGVERLVIVVSGAEPRRVSLPVDRDLSLELAPPPGR